MTANLFERFCSGASREENLLEKVDGKGRCRWCGSIMSGSYPKYGDAITYRCCSAFCQVLYGALLDYWPIPYDKNGDVDFQQAEGLLAEKFAEWQADDGAHGRPWPEDYKRAAGMLRNRYPSWYREEAQKSSEDKTEKRYCANSNGSRHLLPFDAGKRQLYCDSSCRVEAHRGKSRVQTAILPLQNPQLA